MIARIRNRLYRLGLWLTRRYGPDDVRTIALPPYLLGLAKEVVRDIGATMNQHSAEAKHSKALARLQRLAPKAPKRDISLAVELGLRDLD